MTTTMYEPWSGQVSLQKTIPSCLYQEYVDWFNQIGFPVYTGPQIS